MKNGTARWKARCCGRGPFFGGVLAVALAAGCAGDRSESNGEPQSSPATSPPKTAAPAELQPGPVDKDSPEEFTETESGLKYRIRRKGDGPKPTAQDTVTVHYRGWLENETVFDSSYQRGEPATFPLGQVVPGWTEGLQHVQEGGMIELVIPAELGYGPQGTPDGVIPPNATLHFLVELIEVRNR